MLRLQGSGTGLLHSNGVFRVDETETVSESTNRSDRQRRPSGERNGISAPKLFIPIITIVVILHVLIVYLIVSINTTSGFLSTTMQNAGVYTSDASSLLAGTSMLTETSSNFILLPVMEEGDLNIGPLMAYAGEVNSERRGQVILGRFQGYDVDPEIIDLMSEAAACSDQMIVNQLHAIALITSVYALPPIPDLQALPLPELTAEEQAMDPQQKIANARLLILGGEQGTYKNTLSKNVNQVVGTIQAESAQTSARTATKLKDLRILMWVVTLAIVVILFITAMILYRQLIFPLRRFVRLIAGDRTLDEKKGLEEVRLVASAYNNLMERRDALDSILRSAAVTDTLTNLPNRYGYEQYILEAADDASSMALFLFDVNYLKQTNDQLGHAAGDMLLKNAADCILICFGETDESRCFRIGGDEFAAVIRNCNPVQLGKMIEKFEKLQSDNQISVSWGYDYTDSLAQTSVRQLFDQADKNMYDHKKLVHATRDDA